MKANEAQTVDFLGSDAGVAALIRRFDWSATALGPIDHWPQSLKAITGFMLRAPTPMVMLWGPDGYLIYNEGYAEFAGQRHPALLGGKVREAWPEIADFNDHKVKLGLSGGTLTLKDQELMLYRNGRPEPVWLDLDYSPVLDDGGVPAGVMVIVTETTDRVRADAARELVESRLREINIDLEQEVLARTNERGRIWATSPDLFAVLNGQGYFESINPAWRATLGHDDEHIKRTPFIEFVHPDDLPATDVEWERVQRGEPCLRFENRYRHADGGWRWLSWVVVPVDGKFLCSARDVTAEKQAEAERDRLWELSEDMLARADYAGKMSAVNPAWMQVLGWSREELLTNPYADIIDPAYLERVGKALEQMRSTGKPTRFENRVLTKSGIWKPVGWTVSPEPDGVNFIAVGRDLSDDKLREQALVDAQDALRQSQKMEAVGQLTGGIAHDFNNLLAGISGAFELLAKRLGEGRTTSLERYIEMGQTSARRAAALTQRLLAFSRRQTLDPKPTDLNRLAAGMEDLVRRTVGPSIELEVVGAGGLWLTEIDQSQLENALLNLVINARDAMPDGGRITIETANKWLDDRAARERELPPGQYVTLCVTDTGTGMTPDVIERAFDPFFTTKPLGQGTGLGLSMIHGFVRQSGGQVRIYTELGKGTTMCLYLPRFVGEADAANTADELLADGDGGHGETVLVIDDEEPVRALIGEVLRERGYRVIEAGDGAQGLKILQSDARVDLLITDVGLPGGINGRQVADAARISRPELKVLFVTGYAENSVIGNGHLAPGMIVITKPFSMTALANRVREIVER